MLDYLERKVGQDVAGTLIAIVCDALDDYTEDGDREMRTLEITINGFFNKKFNFEEGKYE